MKTKITLFMMCALVSVNAFAQWSTSGTDIYNTNSGNVGIGTGASNPGSKLYVAASGNSTGIVSTFNIASGAESMGFGLYGYLPTSTSNTYLKNTYMLYGNGASLIHMNISNAKSNGTIRFLTGGWDAQTYQRMIITSTGNVGIGTVSPSYPLDVNGSIRAAGYITSSDERLKENISQLKGALGKLSTLGGYTYTFIKSKSNLQSLPEGRQIGLLAQQVQGVFPELVSTDDEGYLGVNYMALVPVLVQAIKELNAEVEILKKGDVSKDQTLSAQEYELIRGSYIQNSPNPFHDKTTFEYQIPEGVTSASLNIYDLTGKEIKKLVISGTGKGQIEVDFNSQPSMYVYSLVLNNKPIITKKMIVDR